MSSVYEALLWALLGAAASLGHLWVLRRAVDTTDMDQARRRIVHGYPVRLIILAPVLLLAARSGMPASLGLISGWTVSRWVLVVWFWTRTRSRVPAVEQG